MGTIGVEVLVGRSVWRGLIVEAMWQGPQNNLLVNFPQQENLWLRHIGSGIVLI